MYRCQVCKSMERGMIPRIVTPQVRSLVGFGRLRVTPLLYLLLCLPSPWPSPSFFPNNSLRPFHPFPLLYLQRQVLRALLLESSLRRDLASWSAFVSFLPTKKPSYDFTSCASHSVPLLSPLLSPDRSGEEAGREEPSPSPSFSCLFLPLWTVRTVDLNKVGRPRCPDRLLGRV